MRLLKIEKDAFNLVEHFGAAVPPYAILSHTWGLPSDEVTFKDMLKSRYKDKAGYKKLQFCSYQANKDVFQEMWIDTCCIDKKSSAELSEAINSMYRWYAGSRKVLRVHVRCRRGRRAWRPLVHARLDVTGAHRAEVRRVLLRTLGGIGDKWSLRDHINKVTGIPMELFDGAPIDAYLASERLSWTRNREAT